jgi:hypothetical protein
MKKYRTKAMRTFKFLGILALMATGSSSCDLILSFGKLPPATVSYQLDLSFQDASGNDLAKGIGLWEWIPGDLPQEQATGGAVKPELFVLDIMISEPCSTWDNKYYNASPRIGFQPDINRPQLSMSRYENGCWYLGAKLSLPDGDCPEQKTLTYQLKCPYLFGDEAVHEFVAYWSITNRRKTNTYAVCDRIEFEDKVIIPKTSEGSQKYVYTSYATIILEGRETQ